MVGLTLVMRQPWQLHQRLLAAARLRPDEFVLRRRRLGRHHMPETRGQTSGPCVGSHRCWNLLLLRSVRPSQAGASTSDSALIAPLARGLRVGMSHAQSHSLRPTCRQHAEQRLPRAPSPLQPSMTTNGKHIRRKA